MLSLLAKLGLDITGFTRGLDAAKGQARKAGSTIGEQLGSDLKSALGGAVTVGAVTRFVGSFASLAKETLKLSRDLGVSTDDAQRLQIAADRTGASTEEISAALTKVAALRARIIAGDEKSLALAKALGLETADFSNAMVSNLDVLQRIQSAVAAQGGGWATQNVAAQMLGDKAQSVLAIMGELKSLGPITLISKQNLDDVATAARELENIKRDLLVSAAPEIGFWSRVVARGSEMERSEGSGWWKATLTRATLRELFDSGPQKSAALTPEDLAAARKKLSAQVPTLEQLGIAEPEAAGKAATGGLVRTPTFDSRIAAGGLASAGLFFGGAGNPLLREAKRQADATERAVLELQRVRNAIREEL